MKSEKLSKKSIPPLLQTNRFRVLHQDFFSTKEECCVHKRKWVQTNPKFPTFDQTIYHAGDEEDFQKYGLLPFRMFFMKKNDVEGICLQNHLPPLFKLYKNIDYDSVYNTFFYLFYKFKKSIFVAIQNNKLAVFLPFSNAKYKNTWAKQTYFSKEEKVLLEKGIKSDGIREFMRKNPAQKQKINYDRSAWVANNCFFRNEYPPYEGELVNSLYKNMLEELLADRRIPDVAFFINPRDFPLLTKNYTEPYEHLYDSDKIKIEKEYQFKKMAPIFSKSIRDTNADILLPTSDDWIIASQSFFLDECSDAYHTREKLHLSWKTKKNICIFRGSGTGCGTTFQTNPRLRAAQLSSLHPDILDARITDWNARMKKYKGKPIDVIRPDELGLTLGDKITNVDKSMYKYILNIEGHVAAFRLSYELSMNSVVLLVESPYKVWYSDWLEAYVHYVPVKRDMSDLISQIEWCRENDGKCKRIASNAMAFFNEHINKRGIFNYLERQMCQIHENMIGSVIKKKKRIAVITIYREDSSGERYVQKDAFLLCMRRLMEPFYDFHIFLIEQSNDGNKFNIGKLKNIGFDLANKDGRKWDNYVFTDIDMIPDHPILLMYAKKWKGPLSCAYRGTRYSESRNVPTFFGGQILVKKKDFQTVNGYPNNFYGWGKEDEALFYRFVSNQIPILFPKKGGIIDLEEYGTIERKMNTLKNKKENKAIEKTMEDMSSWKTNGLSNLKYKVIETNHIDETITQYTVDLMKESDEKKYPELFTSPISMNFNELKKERTRILSKMREETYIYEYV